MDVNKNILTINAGSSSIRMDVFAIENEQLVRVLHADVSGIAQTQAIITCSKSNEPASSDTLESSTFDAAVQALLQVITESISDQSIYAVGHRVVHGGPHYSSPTLITEQLLTDLESIATFDPEHTPAALELMRRMQATYPHAEQVACFDTAFFHTMPSVAQLLPIPRKYESSGLRRYGFHGLSYTYVQNEFAALAGQDAKNGRVIYAHLGSGASVAATSGGKPIDTTMGFTPSSGLVMSSRAGDLDPGLIGYLLQTDGMSAESFVHMINYDSGLKGVSDLSADMYTLLQHESSNRQAADAVSLFVYQVRKAIGSLIATLGGLDSLVFTGGIGEKSAVLRSRICEGFDFVGLTLNQDANHASQSLISADGSRVGVHVIATNEAAVIAQFVRDVCITPAITGGNHGIS